MTAPAAAHKGKTVPVIADHEQTVEIHWRRPNGAIYIERFEYPALPRQSEPTPSEP